MKIVFYYPPGNWHIPTQGMFEDDFPFPKVGYVSSLEGIIFFSIFAIDDEPLMVVSTGLLHL